MRLIHTSDWHLTAGDGWQNTVDCLKYIVATANDTKADALIIAGDIWHYDQPHRAPTPREFMDVCRILEELHEGIRVYGVDGNHDVPYATFPFSLMKRERFFFPYPLIEPPLLFIPYPRKKNFVTAKGVGDQAEQQEQCGNALDDMIRGMVQGHSGLIAIGHFMVGGSQVGGGEKLIGREIELSPSQLNERSEVAYWALGHIHRQQQIAENAWYCGTPTSYNRGETHPKGFNYVEIEDGKCTTVEYIETPARKLVTLRAVWTEHGWSHDVLPDMSSPLVEVTPVLEYREDQADVVDFDYMDRILRGREAIVRRPIRQVTPVARERLPEVKSADTRMEEVVLYWGGLDDAPSIDRQERALTALDAIEADVLE